MISVSNGTEAVLGLTKIRLKDAPTTAYFMLGDYCNNKCKFCSKSIESTSNNNLLSRVSWHKHSENLVYEKLNSSFLDNKLKRACFQVLNFDNFLQITIDSIKKLKSFSEIPVCSSIPVSKISDLDILFNNGCERVCISLDATSETIYSNIKSGNFIEKLSLLKDSSYKFYGRITTHLIVGLGESEYEIIKIIHFLIQLNIKIALFAFTPIKGTPMQNVQKPDISTYRRVQICNYLFENYNLNFDELHFENQTLISICKFDKYKPSIIDSLGVAFKTTGCLDCNRPYYNESPCGIIYNYPRNLQLDEVYQCLKDSNL